MPTQKVVDELYDDMLWHHPQGGQYNVASPAGVYIHEDWELKYECLWYTLVL